MPGRVITIRCTRSRGPRGFFCLHDVRRGPVNVAVIPLGQILNDDSIDADVFAVILDGNVQTAAIHNRTASVADLIEVPKSLQPASPTDLWHKYYRPPLENDGLTSELDFETKHFPKSETLDNFISVNRHSVEIESSSLQLINTAEYESKQDACSAISDCSGWWRFSRVGYNNDGSEALVHTDYNHPRYGLMGTGHFVLLANDGNRWNVVAKHMTWIS